MLSTEWANIRHCFFDVEFIEYNVTLQDKRTKRVVDLISLGIVDDKGRNFYKVSSEFNVVAARNDEWFADNVLKNLPAETKWRSEQSIQKSLNRYLKGDNVIFYYWCATQDPFVLENLLGQNIDGAPNFMTLPRNIKSFVNVYQEYVELGRPSHIMPYKDRHRHHDALGDAIWLKEATNVLYDYKNRQIDKIRGIQAPAA